MTHDEARELIGAVPGEASPELQAHLTTCPECQAYRDDMLGFDAKLRRALELDWQKIQGNAPAGPMPKPPAAVPLSPPAAGSPSSPAAAHQTAAPAGWPPAGSPGAASTGAAPLASPAASVPGLDPTRPGTTEAGAPAMSPTGANRASVVIRSNVSVLKPKGAASVAKHTRPRLFAFAASVAAALLIGGVLWLSRPPESLAAEVVTHVQGEPLSWDKTEPVSAEKLDAVLRKSGVNLGPGMQPVVYASSCWFRGHFVPHVVVTTKDGPVTVMILLHERVNAAQQFNEGGYAGLLVPAGAGSVAVLSRKPMNLEKPAANVVHALQSKSPLPQT